jgi:hypothetical protein
MYIGFLNGNLYHNSTSIVAKPIAFMALIVFAKWLKNTNRSQHYMFAIITTIIAVISALAKPNIPMTIIPAWVLIIGYLFLKDQQRTLRLYALYMIPVIVVLAVMYIQSQVRFYSDHSYGIQWWYVAQHWTPNPLISLILTILFPLIMLVLYPQMWNDKLLIITFISLIVAVLTYWTFYETTNTFSNNFGWGARMMVNALFAVSSAHLIRVYRSVSNRSDIIRLVIVTGVLIAHIVSGIMYTVEMYQSKNPFI